MRIPLWLTLAAAWLLVPTYAVGGPVAAAIVSWIGLTGTAATIATFVIETAIAIAVNAVANKLFGPKVGSSAAQQRQASVLSLTIGEGPREAIFGRAATGGLLLDAFNFGGTNGTDWEVLVIKVADHKCDGFEGFFIGDTFYAWSADGAQSGFNGQLEVYWKDGSAGQAASSYLLTASASRLYGPPWASTDVCKSMAYLVFAYKADAPNASAPVWPQGRPQFKAVVRGKLCYDPRHDSTVAGGSGSQRWATPSSWAWSENAAVCDYNYDRGVYAEDAVTDPTALLVGRGLTAEEADPSRVASRANLCDEAVALKAGGTEPRYRAGGVIFANETFGDIKQKFATAMGGDIVKRQGGVEVLPGAAQSVVRELTDQDLVVGEVVSYQPFLSDVDRVNTVIGHYNAPDQLWANVTAPVRRSTADIAADGGQKTADVPGDLVTSQTQMQRICEIKRRRGRKEKRVAGVLSPVHSDLEDGDWIGLTSDRYFGGGRLVFQIGVYAVQQSWRNNLALLEIDSACFDWTAATDEGVPGLAPVDEFGSLNAVALAGVSIVSLALTSADGTVQPAVKATWTTPVDSAIRGVRLEVRKVGTTNATVTETRQPNDGQLVTTDGVISAGSMEGRLVPLSIDGRAVTSTAWLPVTTAALAVAPPPSSPNLVPNGALSLGTNQWTIANDFGASIDGVIGFFFESVTNGSSSAISSEFKAVAGKDYTLSLFGGTSGTPTSGDAFMDIEWFNSSHAHLSYSSRIALPHLTSGAAYQRAVLTVTAPSSAAFAKARIYTETIVFASGGFTVVSQVKVEQSSTFTGFNDLATAGATYADGTSIDLLKPAGSGATKNIVTFSSTTPGGTPTNGDLWVVLVSGNPVAVRNWNGSAWVTGADLTSNGTSLGFQGQQPWATALIFYQSSTPTGTIHTGDIWIDTTAAPFTTKRWDSSAWQIIGRGTINTNQLTDGAGLGNTAIWASITGTGKPANNADVTGSNYAFGVSGGGTMLFANFYYQSSAPTGTIAAGSLWADTSSTPTVLKQYVSGAWQPIANNSSSTTTFVTLSADSVSNSRSTDGIVTTLTVTATFHGATGTVTWSVLGGSAPTISPTNPSPSSGTTAVSAFSGSVSTSKNDIEDIFIFQGHDSGTGETRSATCQAGIFKSV